METINGFQCRDCTDVGYAKKHIDPAHPKDGPFGVNAPEERQPHKAQARKDPAVLFGGSLSGLNPSDPGRASGGGSSPPPRPEAASGGLLDLRV